MQTRGKAKTRETRAVPMLPTMESTDDTTTPPPQIAMPRSSSTWQKHYELLAKTSGSKSNATLYHEWRLVNSISSCVSFLNDNQDSCLLVMNVYQQFVLLHNVAHIDNNYFLSLNGNVPKFTSLIAFWITDPIINATLASTTAKRPTTTHNETNDGNNDETNLLDESPENQKLAALPTFMDHKSILVIPHSIASYLIHLGNPLSTSDIANALNDLEAYHFPDNSENEDTNDLEYYEDIKFGTNCIRDFVNRATSESIAPLDLNPSADSNLIQFYLNGRSPLDPKTPTTTPVRIPIRSSKTTKPKGNAKSKQAPKGGLSTSKRTANPKPSSAKQHPQPIATTRQHRSGDQQSSTINPPAHRPLPQSLDGNTVNADTPSTSNQSTSDNRSTTDSSDSQDSPSSKASSDSDSTPRHSQNTQKRSKKSKTMSNAYTHNHPTFPPTIPPTLLPQTMHYGQQPHFPMHPQTMPQPNLNFQHNPNYAQLPFTDPSIHNQQPPSLPAPYDPTPYPPYDPNQFTQYDPNQFSQFNPTHVQPPPPNQFPQFDGPLPYQYTFSQLHQNPTLTSHSDEKQFKKKLNRFNSLPDNIRILYLRGSLEYSTSCDPVIPATKLLDFLDCSKKHQHADFLRNELQRYEARGSFNRGHSTKLANNGPLWTKETPEGLTIFAISPSLTISAGDQKKDDLRALKVNNKQKLNDGEYEDLVTKDWHFPQSVQQMETQLYTFVSALKILFGERSILARQVESWLIHLRKFWAKYEAQCIDHGHWGTRVLLSIDNAIQMHFKQLQSYRAPNSAIDTYWIDHHFRELQRDVEANRFQQPIPDVMFKDENIKQKLVSNQQNKASKNKKKEGESSAPNQSKTNQKPTDENSKPTTAPTANITPATNPKRNPKWNIPSNKDFKSCFYNDKKLETPPAHDGKPFCILFHVSGRCKRGDTCQFNHADPRDVNATKEWEDYLKKQYGVSSL